MTQLEESLAHAKKVFLHRFNIASLTYLELKRKRQRAKEQRSKIKKKKTVQLVRKATDFLFKKGFSWEEIDKICPITYGTKGVSKITFKKGFSWEEIDKICPITYGTKGVSKITFNDIKSIKFNLKEKKCLSHLKYISAFDNDVEISSETSLNSSEIENKT